MGTVWPAGVGNVTPGLRVFDGSVSSGNRGCCRLVSNIRSRRDRAATVAKRRGSIIVRCERGGSPPNGHPVDPTRALRRVERFPAGGRTRGRHAREPRLKHHPELPVERFPIGEDGLGDQFGVDDATGLLRVEVVGGEEITPAFGWCVPVDQHGVVVAINSGRQFAVGG